MSETTYEDTEHRERADIHIEKKEVGAREAAQRRDRIWEGRDE